MSIDCVRDGVFRTLLAEDALSRLAEDGILVPGRQTPMLDTEIQAEEFSPQIRTQAAQMEKVYVRFFCLENAVRELITQRLSEKHGTPWWEQKVPSKIREGVEKLKRKEQQNRYLSSRSKTSIGYTFFGNLGQIIIANWEDFSDLFPDQAWVTSRFNDLEMCRNVIMHTNVLPEGEIERIESIVRDWISQVG